MMSQLFQPLLNIQMGITEDNVQATSGKIANITEYSDYIFAEDVSLIAEAVELIVAENNGDGIVSIIWMEMFDFRLKENCTGIFLFKYVVLVILMDQAPQIKKKLDINIVRNFILKLRLFRCDLW